MGYLIAIALYFLGMRPMRQLMETESSSDRERFRLRVWWPVLSIMSLGIVIWYKMTGKPTDVFGDDEEHA